VVVSVTERDGLGLARTADLGAFAAAGLQVLENREATRRDVDGLGSSWAKRLGIPRRRPAWLLRARKP
jgi:hypothetical protein